MPGRFCVVVSNHPCWWNILKYHQIRRIHYDRIHDRRQVLNQKIDGGMGPAEFAICHPPIKNCYHSPKENIQDQTKNSSICWRSKMVIPKDQGCLNLWSSKQNDFRPHVMVNSLDFINGFHWWVLKLFIHLGVLKWWSSRIKVVWICEVPSKMMSDPMVWSKSLDSIEGL